MSLIWHKFEYGVYAANAPYRLLHALQLILSEMFESAAYETQATD